jgi:ribosomal protein L11 methylase PrmA
MPCGWADEKPAKKTPRIDVIYLPTPQPVVEKMLELAEIKKEDVVYDLGCGDGRIVLTAARKYKCKAAGFDIDPERIDECKANMKKEDAEVQKLVSFAEKDIFKQDLSEASVVTMYLLTSLNQKLLPQLEKLKPGTRIVSHAFSIPGIKPDKVVKVKVKDREHTVYLWTTPLNTDKK